MKIGILTYHFVSNFGANLQTLSTFEYLENRGYEPIILNWIPSDLEKYYKKAVPQVQNEAFYRFAKDRYTRISKVCRSSQDIAQVIDEENIELVLIGSDAVLTYTPVFSRFYFTKRGIVYRKPCIDSDFPNAFWGDFSKYLNKSVRIAVMSGSAQNTDFSKIVFMKNQFMAAIARFTYISVRDVWTQNMILKLSMGKVSPPITPDPVFAFNQNVRRQFSKEYILKKFGLDENFVLLSVSHNSISNDWKRGVESEFAKMGITTYELPQANKTTATVLSHSLNFPIDPMEWYGLIKYSKGYVGELMHPILCALHNSVPIYSIDTYGFGKKSGIYGIDPLSSKIYQIINRFGFMDNYCNVKDVSSILNPFDLVGRVLHFDKIRCAQHANELLLEYNTMMNNILIA